MGSSQNKQIPGRVCGAGTLLMSCILLVSLAIFCGSSRHVVAAAEAAPPPATVPSSPNDPRPSPVENTHAPSSQTADSAQTVPEASSSPVRVRHVLIRHPYNEFSSGPAVPVQVQTPSAPVPRPDAKLDQAQVELDAALDQLQQARENLNEANRVQRRTLIGWAIFLAIFAVIAIAAVIQVYLRARAWNRRSLESVREVEAIAKQLQPFRDAQAEVKHALPGLLQEVGDGPLNFEEEGLAFPPKALTTLDEIDHLAYLGSARLSFSDLSAPTEPAVYLNGLLLSSVAHLARSDSWTAFARLDAFFDWLARYPQAVEHHRMAQAYSYRALAAYQVLEAQDREPSWQRKSGRSQTEAIAKQAFADVAQAARLDPEWKHATFVEVLLCSRFYIPDDQGQGTSRAELHVRSLRRAVVLSKELIDAKSYRGPARHNLVRCLKRIAEQTGEECDFSDFGYALSSFPTDEELADEALAARQPASQDRFLWQWMLGDEELFRSVDKLNLAEYRSFWIRLLDNKVHLRNWRADLMELQQKNPVMRDWTIQLLHAGPPISLANAISRRQERFDTPSLGS